MEWFRKAAGQGYADAQYNLGCCYKGGNGVPKEPAQAAEAEMQAVGTAAGEDSNMGCASRPPSLARRPPRKLKGSQGALALARSAPRRRSHIRLRPPSTLHRFLVIPAVKSI